MNYEMTEPRPQSAWPAAGEADALWTDAGGTTHRIVLSTPAWINELDPRIASATTALVEDAVMLAAQFDFGFGFQRPWLRPLLIRAEAAASSRLEGIIASTEDFLRAELCATESRSATLVAANVVAVERALDMAQTMDSDSVREVHRVLMASEPRHTPGDFRQELVWIGGESPIAAVYLPPGHLWAAACVEDVAMFSRRSNLSRLVQVAVAHAQFESIHPFTDGNGRVGRAWIGASLLRQELTKYIGVVPISAGLLASPDEYIAALTSYRHGEIESIVKVFVGAVIQALHEADRLRAAVDVVTAGWSEVATGRSDSGIHKVLELVSGRPVVTAELVAGHLGVDETNAHGHLRRLVELGVLEPRPATGRRGMWVAPAIVSALDDFAAATARRGYGH
ncbi:Fic family protein [Cryobacterium sp. N22]|uniref:Fic family protein n=1 Tax=Cryobacterium sp. N22 TaxID=2048290 RepID=UPI001304DF56|nr:Fic family protein [Cryobacterium sp. N22]